MIALEYLIKINEKKTVIRDNFNRDSSFVQSSQGFVIHSGIHRSTAFISKEEHPNGWFSFTYWKEQGQAAINGFIEATIDGYSLADCEAEAFRRSRPDWQVIKGKSCGTQGDRSLTATRGGALQERVGAATWRWLHARTL